MDDRGKSYIGIGGTIRWELDGYILKGKKVVSDGKKWVKTGQKGHFTNGNIPLHRRGGRGGGGGGGYLNNTLLAAFFDIGLYLQLGGYCRK
jgi:hypothetical protein